MNKKKLQELRRDVDRIDEQIISLLAQRLRLADNLVALKRKLKLEVRDKAREREVIERARALARERKMNPGFVESVMRLVMAQMAGEERERFGAAGMWSRIQKAFEDYPARLRVVRILFKYGLRVSDSGEIACGDIRIPAVQIAKEAEVDRRVVDSTAKIILKDEKLSGIFKNLEPIAYLKGVAHELGLGVIEILPENAAKPGIIKEVTGVVSKFGISIRQAVADDPNFVPQPRLTLITEEPVKGAVIEELRNLKSVRSIIVY
jgi:predicted regulator of amino acid metabolism with ACT domain/chorismate mutase